MFIDAILEELCGEERLDEDVTSWKASEFFVLNSESLDGGIGFGDDDESDLFLRSNGTTIDDSNADDFARSIGRRGNVVTSGTRVLYIDLADDDVFDSEVSLVEYGET